MQLSRSTGTIQQGHVADEQLDIEAYFYYLQETLPTLEWIHAGAFALEIGEKTHRKHIQFYMEHDRKRPRTIAKRMGITTEFAIRTVISASGSWDYCTGTGRYENKTGVVDRFSFGEPILTDTGNKADLKMLVGLIVTGSTPKDILMEHPYAYTVHRRRIWDLFLDLKQYEQREKDLKHFRDRDRASKAIDLGGE